MLNRAYSLLEVKDFDPVQRTFGGTATSPVPDRVGDTIDPDGVVYKNPLPLLLYHDSKKPVGEATFRRLSKDGATPFDARISTIDRDSGVVRERLDEAVDSLAAKPPLIRGVSIGFRPLEDPTFNKATGGFHFPKIEVLELSMVVIPAHQDATIAVVKSLDRPQVPAHHGDPVGAPHNTPNRPGTPVVRLLPTRQEQRMKSLSDQLVSYKSTRDQKWTAMNELMTKAGDAGVTLDTAESDSYETLKGEVKACDEHIARLEDLEKFQKSAAKPVDGSNPLAAAASRGHDVPVIHVRDRDEPGIGFAKSVLCKVASFLSQGSASPLEIAKQRYPSDDRLQTHFKATIPAGTSTHVTWAAPFIDPTNLASEFIDYLRPMTILGKFGTNGIPALRRVPFNVRILGQTSGGDAYWVGEGAPKPVTKFDFNAQTLGFHKVATIAVITKELARFSVPSAERIVRDSMAAAVTGRVDVDLIDPAQAAVTGVNPASLTNGLTPMAPSGTTADAARSDIARVIKAYLDANNNVVSLVLIMPASLALSLSMMRNSLGQREFSDITLNGGSFEGIPVITSQYAANQSGAGNLVIAVNAQDVLLADDGNVTVDVSTQASIQMLDNPTNSSATGTPTTMVSLWQTNSIGLLAEREITWAKARANAVVYMDDVNWGGIGSPA